MRKGFSATHSSAQLGHFELAWLWSDDKPETAQGVFVKSSDFVRMSCQYPDQPLQLANGHLTRVPFDEIRSTERNFNHHSANQFQKLPILSSQKMDDLEFGSRYAPGAGSQDRVTPLSLYGGPPSSLFLDAPQGASAIWDYSEPDVQRIQIVLTCQSLSHNEVRTIIFRRDLSTLVLESIVSVIERGQGVPPLVRAGYAQDFVECQGGPVARKVTQVLGGVSSPLGWISTVWQSDDLATPKSFEDDFVVDLAPNTLMTGLSPDLTKQVASKIDLTKLQVDSFDTRQKMPVTSPPVANTDSRKWFVIANVIAAALFALFLVRRSRQRTKTNE